MPYSDPQKRREAKRRYNATPKALASRRRYYRERHPLPIVIDARPLVQALANWRNP